MTKERESHNRTDKTKGLVTEKDIDPEFGLFTEEPADGHVMGAKEELLRQYPASEQSGSKRRR